ncbi:trypsin-1-like [Penaeus monodon]|uniref:trypsin-1-like n=1 Tax=Penaeus monodon TaxID=6687 RepID=UPI0018A7768F|nr:trypsin-1-like [Penaeus monodon]
MEISRLSLLLATCWLALACLAAPTQGRTQHHAKRSACECSGYVCGTPNRGGRIVGGNETNPGKYPWLVSLSYRGKLYCGATLVNDRYLVTAAHCIKRVTKSRVQIVLGSHNKSDIHEPSRQVRKVGEWWAHAGFDRRTFNNDIGVIKLDTPVTITKYVRPVCLPTQDQSYVGDFGIVPGWGRLSENGRSSDVVREVRVPIMSNSECKTKKYNPSEITDNMMCAGYDAGKIDACQGDSGGPMLWESEGSSQIQLIGVVSWGQGCARAGYPGIYTRIQNYRNFIDAYIREGCFCPTQ